MNLKQLLAGGLMALAGVSATAQPNPNLHIYLCLGQSNMVGQAPILSEDTTDVSDRLLSLCATNGHDRKVGQWRKAVPPLCREYTHMGPSDFFGRTMVSFLPDSVSVGLVVVGVDGCASNLFDRDLQKAYVDSIKPDWMRAEVNAYDGNPRQRLVDMARLTQQRGVIRGIIYHQGETDAYSDAWLTRMCKIYRDLLEDLHLSADSVPLLVGETARKELGGVCAHANPTIDRMHDFLPTAWTISSEGCEVSSDGAHFSHKGYELLGRRYALRMLKLEGYDVAEQDTARLQTSPGAQASEEAEPAFKVETVVNGKRISVSAEVPMATIDMVSFSGQIVGVVRANGVKKLNIHLKNLDDDRLFLVVKATDGRTVRTLVNVPLDRK